jgi:hypothetical protein
MSEGQFKSMKKIALFGFLLFFFVSIAEIKAENTKMGEIAIFNEQVSWTDIGAAKADTAKILKTTLGKVKVYGDKAIGDFAKKRTEDGALDIIITFGYFPVSLYKPGNAEKEDSLAEKFLEGGDMFMNAADYIFYVTQGGGANGENGLKTITDSNFDCWTDGNSIKPTAEGKKYTPSLKPTASQRSLKNDQISDDKNWEVEVVFGDDKGGKGSLLDPVIIRQKEHGGRVSIVTQTPGAVAYRGDVMFEILENYIKKEVAMAFSVEAESKLATTWAQIKNF